MSEPHHHAGQDDTAYVGAPTDYADAEEVPAWMATITKVLVALSTLALVKVAIVILAVLCMMLVAALVLAF